MPAQMKTIYRQYSIARLILCPQITCDLQCRCSTNILATTLIVTRKE